VELLIAAGTLLMVGLPVLVLLVLLVEAR